MRWVIVFSLYHYFLTCLVQSRTGGWVPSSPQGLVDDIPVVEPEVVVHGDDVPEQLADKVCVTLRIALLIIVHRWDVRRRSRLFDLGVNWISRGISLPEAVCLLHFVIRIYMDNDERYSSKLLEGLATYISCATLPLSPSALTFWNSYSSNHRANLAEEW